MLFFQDTGNWVPCGECGPEPTQFQVKGLTPNHKYKFRVRAVNKEGESEPLETDGFIVAKNPYGNYVFLSILDSNFASISVLSRFFLNASINSCDKFEIL